MNLYIAHGSDDSKVCEYGGVEVYLIYANCLKEAEELCPIPEKSTCSYFPERVIRLLARERLVSETRVEKLCQYYD